MPDSYRDFFGKLHSHHAKGMTYGKTETATVEPLSHPRPVTPKPFFQRARSYHRTGVESYYGFAPTCKRPHKFFLHFFDKVKFLTGSFSRFHDRKNERLTGSRQS
jgi:hypothetical protein